MAFNLRNRNFIKLLDFTPEEIAYHAAARSGSESRQICRH